MAEAVTSYRAALEVFTREDHPVDWAMTQENIAIALKDRALRPETEDPKIDLGNALHAVENALEVYDPEHMSFDYGTATKLKDKLLAHLASLTES